MTYQLPESYFEEHYCAGDEQADSLVRFAFTSSEGRSCDVSDDDAPSLDMRTVQELCVCVNDDGLPVCLRLSGRLTRYPGPSHLFLAVQPSSSRELLSLVQLQLIEQMSTTTR